jgi:MFS family permease
MIGCCGALAIFSSTISKSPILPIFAKSLGADGAQIGWIASASTVPGILISYVAGDLADRFGYRKIMIGSLLVFSSAPFLYLLVQTPLELGAVRFYHGFATAAFGPVAMAVVAAFSPKDHTGQNLSLYSSATLVGRALAPAAGGALYQFGGYSFVYLTAGAAALIALASAAWFFRRSEDEKNAAPVRPGDGGGEKVPFFRKLWGVLSYRPLFLVGLLDACSYFAYGAFEMIFPLYAEQLGMSKTEIGLLLGMQLVGMILFKPPCVGSSGPSAYDDRRAADLHIGLFPACRFEIRFCDDPVDPCLRPRVRPDHRKHQRFGGGCSAGGPAGRVAGNPEYADGCRPDLRPPGDRRGQRSLRLQRRHRDAGNPVPARGRRMRRCFSETAQGRSDPEVKDQKNP